MVPDTTFVHNRDQSYIDYRSYSTVNYNKSLYDTLGENYSLSIYLRYKFISPFYVRKIEKVKTNWHPIYPMSSTSINNKERSLMINNRRGLHNLISFIAILHQVRGSFIY